MAGNRVANQPAVILGEAKDRLLSDRKADSPAVGLEMTVGFEIVS
jgi:hypothetical protein